MANINVTSINKSICDRTNIDSIKFYGLNNITSMQQFALNVNVSPRVMATSLREVVFKKCDLSKVVYISYFAGGISALTKIEGIETLSPSENNSVSGGGFGSTKIDYIHPSFFKKIIKLGDHFYGCPNLKFVDISQAELIYFRNTFANSALETLIMGNIANGMEFSGSPFGSNLKNLSFAEGKTVKGDVIISSTNKLTKQSVLNLINAAAANVTYTLHSTVYNKCASGGEWYSDVQAAIDAKALQGYTVTLISA